jgi:carboxyl-terminal processing protease
MRRARAACLICLATAACGGSRTPTTPSGNGIVLGSSSLAQSYLTEIVNLMQANSINRDRINWADVRARITQSVQGAQTIADTYPAISMALGLLDDHHSFYSSASGGAIGNPNGKRCAAPGVSTPTMPADIGYVKVGSFSSPVAGADRAFADAIQQQIRSADAATVVGWIVDVRGNGGGNMWPMVAGVGAVLGEGVAGYFVPPGGARTPWSYQGGGSFSGGSLVAQTSTPYQLMRPGTRVAVLTDNLVASSGEAVVVSFRGRPNARSFGGATCGLSTANQSYRLSDGAMLYLTVAVMADRNHTPYGDSMAPDETVPGDVDVVQRAMAWVRGG